MAFLLPTDINIMAVDFTLLQHALSYRRKMFRQLFKSHYRLAISTDFLRHPNLDESLIGAAAADQSIAMEPRPWPKYDRALRKNRKLYQRLFESGPLLSDKVIRWNRFANWLTGKTETVPVIHVAGPHFTGSDTASFPDVLIQPFSAVKLKQSPPDLYRNMIARLPEGTRIAITGAPGDLDNNPEFRELLKLPDVEFDSSTFENLAPKLKAARLVISVDTALMHLAIVLGAPTLGLASAAYVGEIVPYADEIMPTNAHILYQPIDCQGCLGHCPHQPVDGMYPCVAMLNNDHDRINAAINEIIAVRA